MLKFIYFSTNTNIHIIFAIVTNNCRIYMFDEFDAYSIEIDGECLNQDFDDVDLFGEKTIEDSSDDFGSELQLT